MTEPRYKLAALAVAVAMVGASMGYVSSDPTTAYFTDKEVVNVSGKMPEEPNADVFDNNATAEGSPVDVFGVHSTDDSGIATYEWDFDDDGTIDATGMNQSHSFMDEGEYEVTLVVTDTAGLDDTATTTVTVYNVPPTASVGSDRTVKVDEQVSFDASGTTDPGDDDLTYNWDVDGDGFYERSGVSPTHWYRSEGTYEVSMDVNDGDGGSDTARLSVEVQNVPPNADAGGPLTVVTGEPTLDGSGSSAGDSSDDLKYKWDVDDDGNYEKSGAGAQPGYYYTDNGTYNVTLRLSDGDGGVDTANTTVTVEPDTEPPVAELAIDRTSVNDKSIEVDGTESTDNARIVDYEWTFGDGTTATGPAPAHTYDDPGEYNLTLTVTDSAGYETTTATTVEVKNVPPTADVGAARTVVAGEPMILDASGSSEGDVSDTLRYEWDFDNGTTTGTSDPVLDHIYSEAGTYNVTLAVSDGDGGVDTANTTVTVEPDTEPPVADIDTTQTTATNKTVEFDGTGSSDNARIVDYEWTLEDGPRSSGPTVVHTYDDPGTYSVTLTVTDSAGLETTANATVVVENDPPTADAGDGTETVAGTSVMLDGSGSSEGDKHDSLSYEWDVDDDGTYEKSGVQPDQTYSEAGTYTVTLRVSDGDDGVDTDTTTVVVNEQPPDADAGTDRTITVNETVSFDATGSSDDGTIEQYEWAFGDGTTATGATPTHTYTETDTYTVTLTVTDDDGNTDTDTIQITVK